MASSRFGPGWPPRDLKGERAALQAIFTRYVSPEKSDLIDPESYFLSGSLKGASEMLQAFEVFVEKVQSELREMESILKRPVKFPFPEVQLLSERQRCRNFIKRADGFLEALLLVYMTQLGIILPDAAKPEKDLHKSQSGGRKSGKTRRENYADIKEKCCQKAVEIWEKHPTWGALKVAREVKEKIAPTQNLSPYTIKRWIAALSPHKRRT